MTDDTIAKNTPPSAARAAVLARQEASRLEKVARQEAERTPRPAADEPQRPMTAEEVHARVVQEQIDALWNRLELDSADVTGIEPLIGVPEALFRTLIESWRADVIGFETEQLRNGYHAVRINGQELQRLSEALQARVTELEKQVASRLDGRSWCRGAARPAHPGAGDERPTAGSARPSARASASGNGQGCDARDRSRASCRHGEQRPRSLSHGNHLPSTQPPVIRRPSCRGVRPVEPWLSRKGRAGFPFGSGSPQMGQDTTLDARCASLW